MSRPELGDEAPFTDAPKEVVAALGGVSPTVQQWRAISHQMEPGVIVAGAGSGKTAVMAARLVYLALVATGRLEAGHRGALPSQALCLTFTNKAAEELSRRVLDAVAALGLPEGEEPTVHTYHAFAARLLDDYGLRMGVEPGPMLLSEAQKWQLVRSLLDDPALEFDEWEIRSDYIVGQALMLSDSLANHLVDPDEAGRVTREILDSPEVQRAKGEDGEKVRSAQRKRIELIELVKSYRARKRELGAIDYGDQISLAVELVEAHPEIVEEFRARYPVVLLDEYQDTNHAQARLLRALCGPGYPVLAVGDPDQNIYAWRGASLHNILRFEQDFGPADGQIERPLFVNFRSGSRILDVANRSMDQVPEERRAVGKELHAHESRGEGRVRATMASDAYSEGRHIAEQIKTLHETEGIPWQEFAILCRKSRLYGPIVDSLQEAEIPVEVVDLGGLLRFPEVVEVVAWLRLLEDPSRNIPLARILMGPRWRIGYRDLRALAAWSATENRELRDELFGEEDLPGEVAFSLVESLDHLDDPMEGLSGEARVRLEEFKKLLAELQEAAKSSLGDLVERIIERSGLWQELEASSKVSAVSARRNLLNLIQAVTAFAPVEGEASLSTLISYLDTAEETEDQLEPAQPSQTETVKVLTIHKAKGLEWDVVFVPGLAADAGQFRSSLFPDVQRQPNPLTQPAQIPFESRGDRDNLPRYGGDLRAFKKALKERGMEEERRLCYVAFTRARKELFVSASYWHESPSEPFQPSVFLRETAGHPSAELMINEECPEESPLLEIRARRAAGWPRPARPGDSDRLFPEGWHAAAIRASQDPGVVEELAAALTPGDREEYRKLVAADRERAALIESRTATDPEPGLPSQLSTTSLLDYEKCPKLFYWSQIRPLPRRANAAARLGSRVHKWIELQATGQATLLDLDEPDLSTDERLSEPTDEARLREAFRSSRFSDKVPLFSERKFLLSLDGIVVGGRIDAIFGQMDGPWEVVDYKTGRVPPPDDPLTGLQLDVYALACAEVWDKRPEDLTLIYFYLREGKEVARPAGDLSETRARISSSLQRMSERRFDPTPGPQCRWCDFRSFCDAGQAFVESQP